jgi:hypothetical protein
MEKKKSGSHVICPAGPQVRREGEEGTSQYLGERGLFIEQVLRSSVC